MTEGLSKSDVAWARGFVADSPRLAYLFESALDDLEKGRNHRQFRLDRASGALALRSKFGDRNVFHLKGAVGPADFEWVCSFPESGELHCDPGAAERIRASPLGSRVTSLTPVAYYLLADPSPGEPVPIASRVTSENAAAATDFLASFGDDRIHSAGMLTELPAFGIWLDGALVSVAATLSLSQRLHACEIGCFLTRPDHRGKGYAGLLGRTLIYALVSAGIRAIRLEIQADNLGARQAYETLGFRVEEQGMMGILETALVG